MIESKAKVVIVAKDLVKLSKQAIASIKKPIHLLTFNKTTGVESIIKMQQSVDITKSPISEPDFARDIEEDHCLIFLKNDSNGKLVVKESLIHADAFLTGMNLIRRHDYLLRHVIDEETSFFEKTGILYPLIALERKILYIFPDKNKRKLFHSKVSPKHKSTVSKDQKL